MPKLLQINSCVNYSSTGKIVEHLAVTARNKGWETYVAHGARDNGKTDQIDLRIDNITTEYIHAFYSRLYDAHGLGSIISTNKLVRKMKKIRPDVVHLHNIHGYYINYPILFKYLAESDIPVVWTFHDCWPITGHCAYFDQAACEKWKTHCYDCELKAFYPSSFIDKSYQNYDIKKKYFTMPSNIILVPVSHWLDDILMHSYLNKYKSKVIHNGIDLDIFKPKITNIRKQLNLIDKFVILGVATGWGKEGRLKGFLNLRNLLDDSYVIVLIGLKKEQICELPKGIIGIERTTNPQELAEYYTMADVFANPTLQDNFPTTNIEALACGTPVVTYKTGGSPEAIDESTGIVVEKDNVSQLKSAILKIKEVLNKKNENAPYSLNRCFERAVIHYNRYDRYNDYIKIYNSLI